MIDVHHRRCGILPQAVPAASRVPPTEALAKAGRRDWVHKSFRTTSAVLLVSLVLLSLRVSAQPQTPTTRVGIPLTLTDLYIPGGEVKPKPRPNHEPPIVIRLIAAKPAADGRRYDLEVYGLDAGTYNLADFLVPVDPATPPRFDTPIPVTITTGLPPGLTRPSELTTDPPPRVGGYRVIAWTLGILWFLGLLVLIFFKRRTASAGSAPPPPPTFAERLHALLSLASEGNLDADQQASLERLILGHWHQRLPELAGLQPAAALAKLRHHQEAGPLLRQLEHWLHARDPEITEGQIEALLAPYRSPSPGHQ